MAAGIAAQLANLRLGVRQAAETQPWPKAFTSKVSQSSTQLAKQRKPLKVVAARVGGVEIPNNKLVEFSLQYIYGIGPSTAKAVVTELGAQDKRLRELSEEELSKLRDEVDKYSIEGDLRRFNAMNIRRLKEIQCYRGRRHIQNLPTRGQRSKTNARTRKGRAKTVAGKKKAPK